MELPHDGLVTMKLPRGTPDQWLGGFRHLSPTMKILPPPAIWFLKTTLCLALWPALSGQAQTAIPFDDFEAPSFAIGNLNGQQGWTVTNIAGTSQALVSGTYSFTGNQSLYLMDGDSANNPKAWLEPTGSNTSHGSFDFAVKEDPATTGRDYWTVVFSALGSNTAHFKLALINATTLTLYGGAGGTSALASVSTTSVGGTYDPTDWNTFSIIFNEATNTASVFLNDGNTPILNATDSGTDWTSGRYQFSTGNSTFTNMAAYFDLAAGPLPEWETTAKLRYAPRTLVAPTIWSPGNGFATRTFADDEDVIVQFSTTQARTGNLGIVKGRNVRAIGGDLGTTYIAPTGQTESLFLEGLKINQSAGLSTVNGCLVELNGTRQPGCLEKDAMDVCGTTSGSGASVFVQNCSIKGVHGTSNAHGAAVPLQTINCTGTSGTGGFNVTITTSSPMTLNSGTNWVIVGATNQPKLNGTYKITLPSTTTGTVFNGVRWDSWNPMPAAPFGSGTTGAGGYIWPNAPTVSPLHADGYEAMAEGMYEIAYFYRVTIESNAQGFLGINQFNTEGMRNLVMTRVNMSVNNIWPQNYDSATLYLGTSDQSGGGWGSNGFPVTLDRVYIRPRPNRTLVAAVYPGVNTTRNGVNVSAFSPDGDLTVQWPAVMGITGSVTKSSTGFSDEPGYTTRDYADLSGLNAPGLNYVSPGYSAETMQPLNIINITGTPALTGPITLPVNSPGGTIATRLDVDFTGDGRIIDLTATESSGRFGIDTNNKRNIVVKSSLAAGTYTVTVTASEAGNPTNSKTRLITINVP